MQQCLIFLALSFNFHIPRENSLALPRWTHIIYFVFSRLMAVKTEIQTLATQLGENPKPLCYTTPLKILLSSITTNRWVNKSRWWPSAAWSSSPPWSSSASSSRHRRRMASSTDLPTTLSQKLRSRWKDRTPWIRLMVNRNYQCEEGAIVLV